MQQNVSQERTAAVFGLPSEDLNSVGVTGGKPLITFHEGGAVEINLPGHPLVLTLDEYKNALKRGRSVQWNRRLK